jgi:23S rRNA (guanine745-N1)-methyltransferase
MIWTCPVCSRPLVDTGPVAMCNDGHSFDRARQGYLNLLLSHQKKALNPGDSLEMVRNRRAFMSRGHFQELRVSLTDVIARHPLKQPAEKITVLDVGCGEGYLSSDLDTNRCDIYGVDISREAVKLAARDHRKIQFAVASSFRLPVQSQSVDLLLRSFAPGPAEEIRRVLSPDGALIIVTPGPRHLYELKSWLYKDVQEHKAPDSINGFILKSQDYLNGEFTLQGREQIVELLTMTPFNWRGDRTEKESMLKLTEFKVSMDFVISYYVLDKASS